MLKVPARVEPHQLCEDDALRPDIQLDLPDYTLLGDVTVNHPNALSWRKKAAKRGVAAVGDERAKQKDDKYAAMAKVVDAEFSAFVLYTYGGFHRSALSFIDKLAAGCDPAVALVPLADWKDDLKDRIAVCVQRHTADIVIDDARRARMASIPVRGRAAGGPSGRPRPSAVAASLRRQREAVERLCAEGGRAASLCAGLLVSLSPSSGPSEDVSPMSVDSDAPTEPRSASPVPSVSFVPETVMTESVEAASCVPGTPGMDGASPDVSGTGGGVMPELSRNSCISHCFRVRVGGRGGGCAVRLGGGVGGGWCVRLWWCWSCWCECWRSSSSGRAAARSSSVCHRPSSS